PLFSTDAKPRAESAWTLCRGAKEEESFKTQKGDLGGNVNMKKDVIVDYSPSLRPLASVVNHHLKVIFVRVDG
ncbi:MAG: hypothetical protein IIX04_06510, partial [Alistipes sp.]|nr:hypothetical protein [Alistipes sp.]